MTIASEITRLQWAKADICTAIEDKGVTVWSIKIDQYCECIKAIQTWGNEKYVDVLVIGWWWSWWWWGRCSPWGWGGAGGAVYMEKYLVGEIVWVAVGAWGASVSSRCRWWCSWQISMFWWLEAFWWGAWWWESWATQDYVNVAPKVWWSWGGSSNSWCGWVALCLQCCIWASWLPFQGSWWGNGNGGSYSWWGWGAGWGWNSGVIPCYGWQGWKWVCTCISWKMECFAWGWGAGSTSTTVWWLWVDWGGNWGYCASWHYNWCPWTTCGSGWWGTWRWVACPSWAWACGVVIVRYPTNGSYGITSSYWGDCSYVCNWYCIHCFKKWWWFITSIWSGKCFINYLVVGGWGWWYIWWGGWGAVCCGAVEINRNSICVIVWSGGAVRTWNWGASCIRNYFDTKYIRACGGIHWCHQTQSCTDAYWCLWFSYWGTSWWGCKWWVFRTSVSCSNSCITWWGGWWARGLWNYAEIKSGYWTAFPWVGGLWFQWYGWGGSGAYCNSSWVVDWVDWGGAWVRCLSWCTAATNCWGWWGGASTCTCAWAWACWVVEICYPSNWCYWFTCATWGTKSLVNGYCVHRFTASGTFTIVS